MAYESQSLFLQSVSVPLQDVELEDVLLVPDPPLASKSCATSNSDCLKASKLILLLFMI